LVLRFIVSIITTSLVCYGGYWFWQNNPNVQGLVTDFISKQVTHKEFQTLELRYNADQVMESAKSELIRDHKYKYSEPQLKFYPYVLLDVKFSRNQEKTEEGTMLFSLVDGELILDTKSWEKTHGYEDCINAKVTKAEFLLLNTLARQSGLVEKKQLLGLSGGDPRAIENTINSCKKKKLLVEYAGGLRLHFDKPKLAELPVTRFDQPVVTKSYSNQTSITSNYTISQIKFLAESAFGKDFSIRGAKEVFLPIYTIRVENPDGTIQTTHWNGVNGSRMDMDDNHPEASSSNPLQSLLSGN